MVITYKFWVFPELAFLPEEVGGWQRRKQMDQRLPHLDIALKILLVVNNRLNQRNLVDIQLEMLSETQDLSILKHHFITMKSLLHYKCLRFSRILSKTTRMSPTNLQQYGCTLL